MTDPFDALRAPVTPVPPDPAFAERLRRRLQRVLLDTDGPEGAEMTTTSETTAGPAGSAPHREVTVTPSSELAWGPSLTPYLLVPDARRALAWYAEVFGAERRGEPYVMPDGLIGHAELGIGDAVLMLAEYGPGTELTGTAQAGARVAYTIFVGVDDTDATVERAVEAGAELERPPGDQEYGRTAVIIDPFGHRWMVNTRPRTATRARPGDVAHLRLFVRDEERMRSFYAGVLGPRALENPSRPTMLVLGEENRPPQAEDYPEGVIPIFRVADVHVAVERARAAGGTATDPVDRRFGPTALVTDPEGNTVEVWQPPEE